MRTYSKQSNKDKAIKDSESLHDVQREDKVTTLINPLSSVIKAHREKGHPLSFLISNSEQFYVISPPQNFLIKADESRKTDLELWNPKKVMTPYVEDKICCSPSNIPFSSARKFRPINFRETLPYLSLSNKDKDIYSTLKLTANITHKIDKGVQIYSSGDCFEMNNAAHKSSSSTSNLPNSLNKHKDRKPKQKISSGSTSLNLHTSLEGPHHGNKQEKSHFGSSVDKRDGEHSRERKSHRKKMLSCLNNQVAKSNASKTLATNDCNIKSEVVPPQKKWKNEKSGKERGKDLGYKYNQHNSSNKYNSNQYNAYEGGKGSQKELASSSNHSISSKGHLGISSSSSSDVSSSLVDSSNSMDNLLKEEIDPFVAVQCKTMYIGSYKTAPIGGIIEVKDRCFKFRVPNLVNGKPSEDIRLKWHGIKKIEVNLKEESVTNIIAISVSEKFAVYVRDLLKMTLHQESYLDPNSEDETMKRIIIFVNEKMKPEKMSSIYDCWCAPSSRTYQNDLLSDISSERVSELLDPYYVKCQDTNVAPERMKSQNLVTYPPLPHKGGITVTSDDFYCLEVEQFLNDVIIDFYLNWLVLDRLSEEDKVRTHVFSTFFYKRLTCKLNKRSHSSTPEEDKSLTPEERRHARVSSWTKNVDIFAKDFILVPVNEESHWFLAVICFPGLEGPVDFSNGTPILPQQPTRYNNSGTKLETKDVREERNRKRPKDDCPEEGRPDYSKGAGSSQAIKQPCILIFDSLPTRSRSRVVSTLREYLSVEYFKKKKVRKVFTKENMKGASPIVPRQNNFSDCGLFTLQFAEAFFQQPLKNYRFPLPLLDNWFEPKVVTAKREEIAYLIKHLMDRTKPDHGITLPSLTFSRKSKKRKSPPPPPPSAEEPDSKRASFFRSNSSSSEGSFSIRKSDTVAREIEQIRKHFMESQQLRRHRKESSETRSNSPLMISDDDDSGNHSEEDAGSRSFFCLDRVTSLPSEKKTNLALHSRREFGRESDSMDGGRRKTPIFPDNRTVDRSSISGPSSSSTHRRSLPVYKDVFR